MTPARRVRTVDDVSAPYSNYLVPVPRAGEGVCLTCHSSVSGYDRCFRCNKALTTLGRNLVADATAFISLAPTGGQMARELYTYKKSEIRLDIRQQRTVGLAAVLWRWLSIHEIHVAQAAHTPKFSVITSVPSTNGRVGEHPLKHLVSSIVSGSDDRYADLLEPQSTSSDREADRARFRTTKSVHNASVLVIDDTWTTGARAQSAAAALKLGGASRVGFVAIGRWFRVDYENNAAWLAHVRRRAWSWDRCCLE